VRALKLTIYLGERDRASGRLATDAIARLLANAGVRIATLLRGTEGFGLDHGVRTHGVLTLSDDLPLVWVAFDEPERIERAAEAIDALLPRGLVTLERAALVEGAGDLRGTGAEAGKLIVHLGRGRRAGGRAAHLAVVDGLRAIGVEGAVVLLGVDGVREGRREPARLFHGNRRVPLMVVCVGRADRLAAALDLIGALGLDATVAFERVSLLKRDGTRLAGPRWAPAEDAGGLGLWSKVTVFTGADAPGGDAPLAAELLRRLRSAGAAGATVLGGIWGYSGADPPDGDRLLGLRRRVPSVVVAVDRPGRMAAAWPEIDRLTRRHGLVTGELVPAFRAGGSNGRVGGLRLAATGAWPAQAPSAGE
jgi:PII-like signaling protein